MNNNLDTVPDTVNEDDLGSVKNIYNNYENEISKNDEIKELTDSGDYDGYSPEDILRTVLLYKKDSLNFFWGDLMKNCNKFNRKADDGWYKWTKDMLMACDENEMRMRKVVMKDTHGTVQNICEAIGDGIWNIPTNNKIKNLVRELKKIDKLIISEKGMKTCWGVLKYESVFLNKLKAKNKINNDTSGKKKPYDVQDYFKYLKRKWTKHYNNFKEKEDASNFYYKY